MLNTNLLPKKLIARFSAIRYLIASGLSVVFELTLFTLLVQVAAIEAGLATASAQAITIIVNFMLVKHFAFKSKGKQLNEFLKYITLVAFNIGFSSIVMGFLVPRILVHPTILRFGLMIITYISNYFLSKYLIFKEKTPL